MHGFILGTGVCPCCFCNFINYFGVCDKEKAPKPEEGEAGVRFTLYMPAEDVRELFCISFCSF